VVAEYCASVAQRSVRQRTIAGLYEQKFLVWSVINRSLKANVSRIDLVVGYSNANKSPILKLFFSRLDELIARVARKADDR
jgi:LysR family transcriptional regulator, hca operon transcriptional activator